MGLFHVEKIGSLKLKECGVILIKTLQDLSHDGFPHEFGFIPDLIFLAIEKDGLLFPIVKQYRGPVGPSQFIVFLLLHLAFIELVSLKIAIACRYHGLRSTYTINNFLTSKMNEIYIRVKNTIK